MSAPAPAVVVSILVQPGDCVFGGQPLAILEAMKMEMQVVAPFSGRVRQVLVIPYVQVGTGAPLVQLDPIEGEASTDSSERVAFSQPAESEKSIETTAPSRCRRNLEELRQLILGFDVDPRHAATLVAECGRHPAAQIDSEEIRRLEDEILEIFVDICSLFRRHPTVEDVNAGEAPSAEVHLFAYLRMLERQGEGLPTSFLEALRRALAHYGVTSLERAPELEEAMLWIYKSHQRLEQQAAPVLAVLERRLECAELAPHAAESFRDLLDRIIAITRGQFPAISDLAREVRYRYFDQPLFERARREVYRQVEDHLAALAAHPDAADRHERLRALTECPQPLVSLFCGRFRSADMASRRLMLEVLTWRYYRIRELSEFRSFALDDRCCASAEYDFEGRHIHAFTTHTEYSEIGATARSLCSLIASVPPEHDVVIDFYAGHKAALAEPDTTEKELRSVLHQVGFPRQIRRVVVVAAALGSGTQPDAGLQHFTFRQSGSGFVEDKFYRGVHPMMGKRLHLWRFGGSKILPSNVCRPWKMSTSSTA